MTVEQERILSATHADTREIVGILKGGNGGGVIKDVQNHTEDIKELKEHRVTEAKCLARRATASTTRWNVWKVITTVVPWIGLIVMILWGTGVLSKG